MPTAIPDFLDLVHQLEDVVETDHGRYRRFEVAGRTLGYLWEPTRTVGLKQTIAEQQALVAERPEVFEVQYTAYGFGWVVVHLEGVERDELAELTFEAWRLSAPAALLEARGRDAAGLRPASKAGVARPVADADPAPALLTSPTPGDVSLVSPTGRGGPSVRFRCTAFPTRIVNLGSHCDPIPARRAPRAARRRGGRVLEVVELVRAGDVEAFGELFDRFHGSVYRQLHTLTRSESVAEELTSETFFRGAQGDAGVQPPGPHVRAVAEADRPATWRSTTSGWAAPGSSSRRPT